MVSGSRWLTLAASTGTSPRGGRTGTTACLSSTPMRRSCQALSAAIARLSGLSGAHGFQIVSGGVYCLGPAGLFLMAWQLPRRAGWSFVAAAVYSLSSASELLLPDTNFSLSHIRGARRLYISFVWDELPHQLALALACLAVLFLARALRDRRFHSFVWAGLLISLTLLASAFAATGLLLFAA